MKLSICLGFPLHAGEVGTVEARLGAFLEGLGLQAAPWRARPDDIEPLLLADVAIVDVSSRDPSLLYAVGARHGMGRGCTIALCEGIVLPDLPFALGIGALIPYALNPRGDLRSDSAAALRIQLKRAIEAYTAHGVETNDPTLRALLFDPGRPAARKMDEFIQRLHRRALGPVGRDVSAALGLGDEAAREQLRLLLGRREEEGYGRADLLAIFVGFREAKGYAEMVALADTLPPGLAGTSLIREQKALALNRMAEATDEPEARDALVARALAELDAIAERDHTSETCGIRGRIHKAAFQRSGDEADRRAAIAAYADGLRRDPRDIYPGINAVTLAFASPSVDDQAVFAELLPVVRFSHASATAESGAERYWHHATGVELGVMAQDWDAAEASLDAALGDGDEELAEARKSWMLSSTADTLDRLAGDWPHGEAPERLRGLTKRLRAAATRLEEGS